MKAIIAAAFMVLLIVLALASPASAQWCKNLPVGDLFNLCPVLDPLPPRPAPPPPPPSKVWWKATGTNEEFAQVRHQCFGQAHMTIDPNGFMSTNGSLFDACMNAKGWTLKAKQ